MVRTRLTRDPSGWAPISAHPDSVDGSHRLEAHRRPRDEHRPCHDAEQSPSSRHEAGSGPPAGPQPPSREGGDRDQQQSAVQPIPRDILESRQTRGRRRSRRRWRCRSHASMPPRARAASRRGRRRGRGRSSTRAAGRDRRPRGVRLAIEQRHAARDGDREDAEVGERLRGARVSVQSRDDLAVWRSRWLGGSHGCVAAATTTITTGAHATYTGPECGSASSGRTGVPRVGASRTLQPSERVANPLTARRRVESALARPRGREC